MPRGRPSRATVYARLDAAIAELDERLGGLPSPKESEFVWSDIWHLEAHHSTALEGNTLALREVEVLLEQGRAVGSKPLKEYMEVQGYGAAARWVYARALTPGERHDGTLISFSEVSEIHRLTMTPVWQVAPHPDATEREAPGMFREHEIAAFAGGMKPPSWPLVPSRLRDWIDLVQKRTDDLKRTSSTHEPIPEILAAIHNEFECIHPFIDGNGRTGRLALNLILVRLGYPPVIVLKTQRSSYLTAMHKSDNGDHGPLGEILARAMYDNLNRFIVPSLAGPARLVPLTSLADDQFSVAALRQAAQRGRLDAVQGADGVWRTTRRAVQDYARTKGQHRKRPGS
ncbi:cell filamentation protein Fic [Mycobacteroides chelonae]|uniref:Fic family protein n=1 Tax=Mycobacteroides chelonae TaxID=1774 RepID=UPI0008A9B9F8|nr:Fic family protein [Mycobacteroides chelonae]OHU23654.1 cell filamentation protein Fic [Mycobacteroides chelonae]